MTNKILVVDDDLVVRRLLKVILEADGYDVTTAKDGAEALNKMRESRPDLVCCDLMMPEIDGFGVIEAMRNDDDLKAVPLIAITAAGRNSYIERALELGANECVLKPFAKNQLLAIVSEVLHEAQQLT